ncbi:hypothetical protein QV05_05350 [Gallibacterium genomosp. 1]|uniref:Transposase n=1 Tax=Gallibacterium genomosp. 1 TaxID=155515 RepID=A0AB36DWZ9_9PAST|nr:hypothetical protein QV04_07270 [Gallibacterium genomosp. 1]OBX01625.1 hypothetical protein QV05_05350 [Gallibacterium genomosp. 1]
MVSLEQLVPKEQLAFRIRQDSNYLGILTKKATRVAIRPLQCVKITQKKHKLGYNAGLHFCL